MAYHFSAVEKPGYLHVKVSGDNKAETVWRYLDDVRSRCIQFSIFTVLIEENLEGPGLNVGDVYRVVSERAIAFPAIRVAYVDVNKTHSLENMQFAETVAVNRGLQVAVFSSVGEAEKWLTAKK